jgi:hypothetical protein
MSQKAFIQLSRLICELTDGLPSYPVEPAECAIFRSLKENETICLFVAAPSALTENDLILGNLPKRLQFERPWRLALSPKDPTAYHHAEELAIAFQVLANHVRVVLSFLGVSFIAPIACIPNSKSLEICVDISCVPDGANFVLENIAIAGSPIACESLPAMIAVRSGGLKAPQVSNFL